MLYQLGWINCSQALDYIPIFINMKQIPVSVENDLTVPISLGTRNILVMSTQ